MAAVRGVDNVWLRGLLAQGEADLRRYGAVLAGTVIIVAVYDVRLAAVVLAAGVGLAATRGSRARRYHEVRRGADAELETARMLALLPAGFTVLNDLTFRQLDVDHVVVGPTGVWAIETKPFAGVYAEDGEAVLRNGRAVYHDPRLQAKAAAAAVSGLLRRETGKLWWVESLVCLPNASVDTGDAREARMVGAGQLLKRLRLAPVRLDADQRDVIVAALARVHRPTLDRVA